MWCLLRRIVLILLEFRAVHGGWFGSVIPSVEGWEGRPGGIGDADDGNTGAAAMGVGATMGVDGSEGGGSLSVAVS